MHKRKVGGKEAQDQEDGAMAEISWDEELRGEVQSVLGSSEHVHMAFYVEKSTSSWGIGGRRSRSSSSQQRILALTGKHLMGPKFPTPTIFFPCRETSLSQTHFTLVVYIL